MSSHTITETERAHTEKEVRETFLSMVLAAEKADLDGMGRLMTDGAGLGSIVNSVHYPSVAAFVAAFRPHFAPLASQRFPFTETKILVLSNEAALVVASGPFTQQRKDGATTSGRIALTCFFQKSAGKWSQVHIHESTAR